jgi:hypothetical protein
MISQSEGTKENHERTQVSQSRFEAGTFRVQVTHYCSRHLIVTSKNLPHLVTVERTVLNVCPERRMFCLFPTVQPWSDTAILEKHWYVTNLRQGEERWTFHWDKTSQRTRCTLKNITSDQVSLAVLCQGGCSLMNSSRQYFSLTLNHC